VSRGTIHEARRPVARRGDGENGDEQCEEGIGRAIGGLQQGTRTPGGNQRARRERSERRESARVARGRCNLRACARVCACVVCGKEHCETRWWSARASSEGRAQALGKEKRHAREGARPSRGSHTIIARVRGPLRRVRGRSGLWHRLLRRTSVEPALSRLASSPQSSPARRNQSKRREAEGQ